MKQKKSRTSNRSNRYERSRRSETVNGRRRPRESYDYMANETDYYEDYYEEYYGRTARPARSSEASRRRRTEEPRGDQRKRRVKRRGRRTNTVSKTFGLILAAIQFILSVFFVVNMVFFDVLTSTYILILIAILTILLGITLLSQIGAKGKGVAGKIFCIFMCIALAAGSFYIGEVNEAIGKITGSNKKTRTIAVAVLKDDPAKSIEDAKDYVFGVQYKNDEAQMRSAVTHINEDIKSEIEIKECTNMIEEVECLYNGEVGAIIYNTSWASVVDEQFETFDEDIRIIYSYSIEIAIENEAVDASVNEPFAVYLSGIDVYGDISQESRSDVNIVAVVNPKSHQILLITTPRDYHIEIPGISNGQPDKLTHAGIYGVDASMNALGNLYDLEIPFFARVNFSSLIDIVDALGGLDVYSDATFTTSTNSGKVINVQEGMNHFDGKDALAFCRERKNLPDGDNARGRHQQAVITAMIKKLMSPAMLRGASDLIAGVSDGIDTNFSMDQIQIVLKNQLRTNAKWNIYSISAKGIGAMKPCYSSGSQNLSVQVPDTTSVEEIKALVDKVEAGETIEGSTSTAE